MDPTDYVQKIVALSKVSDAVKVYIDDNDYLYLRSEGVVDMMMVYYHCLDLALDEIKEYGVIYLDQQPLNGYTGETIRCMLEFLSVTLPNKLVTSTNSELEHLKATLTSTHALPALYLQMYDSTDMYQTALNDYIYDWTFNELFTEYVIRLIETNLIMRPVLEDPTRVLAYVDYKLTHIERMTRALTQLKRKHNLVIPKEEFELRLQSHDKDLLLPEELNITAVFWMIRKGELNASGGLQLEAKEHHDAHHYRSPHHIEYWDYCGITNITLLDKLEIVADIYDQQPTQAKYMDDVILELSPYENHPTLKPLVVELKEIASTLDLW